jgi:hypothetical protein
MRMPVRVRAPTLHRGAEVVISPWNHGAMAGSALMRGRPPISRQSARLRSVFCQGLPDSPDRSYGSLRDGWLTPTRLLLLGDLNQCIYTNLPMQ